mmetsp:Transcript_57353/g.134466  ORF Transcript_57353/g.134466 Transcript_57353/m.134466 type:complete len:308 (+) Transcript_57353:80-1003(+)
MGGALTNIKNARNAADILADPHTVNFVRNAAAVGGACSVVLALSFPRLSQCIMAFLLGGTCSALYALKVCLSSEGKLLPQKSAVLRWKVITQDGDFLPQTASFTDQAEAERFYKAVGDERPCVLLSPTQEVVMANELGNELQFEVGDPLAQFRENLVEAVVPGKWLVLQEVAPFRVTFHAFEDREKAEELFRCVATTRILLDPSQKEVCCGGVNLWGLDTLRSRADTRQVNGLVAGKWMVLTDDGTKKAGYHAFDTQEEATDFFRKFGVGKSRLLLDDTGAEVKAAGLNVLARRFLRRTAELAPKKD